MTFVWRVRAQTRKQLSFLQFRYFSSDRIDNLSSFASNKLLNLNFDADIQTRIRFKTVSDINCDMDINEMSSILNESAQSLAPSDFMLSTILPIRSAQNLIDILHDFSPYYCAIICVPFLLKFLVSIPIAVYSQRTHQKILPLLPSAMKEFRAIGAKYGTTDKKKMDILSKKITAKYGFHPMYASFRPLVGIFIQLPVHMTFFIATRTMFNSYPDWKFGGLAWFPNLSIADPYFILPCFVASAMAVSFANSMRLQSSNITQTTQLSPEAMKYLMGFMCIAMVPISHMFSAGFNVYMTANILSYMMQSALLNMNGFRYVVGLKPASWQAQYQRELNAINSTHKQKMKNEVMSSDVKYEAIKSRRK